jgi:CRP-like cAMP-binding protein
LFALHSGLVKIVKSLENGKDRIAGVLLPGEFFGLEALTDATYPLTAVALSDCEVCSAPREEFAAYMRTYPDIALGMVRFLVDELKRVRSQMTDMSFKDARMKVATLLLSLTSTNKTADNNAAITILLPLSRQEISEVLELSPETISRTFSHFRDEKMVSARGRHLIIHNRTALESVAHR